MDIANLVIRVTNDGLTAAQRELRRLRDEVNRNVDANKKMKEGLDDLSKWAAIGLGALTGGIVLATKKAMSFETAMAGVNKTVDFTTKNGLSDLKDELLELSRVIPLPFEELADIAAAGGQGGIADKQLGKYTETIAKMAIAFDMAAGQTSDSMAKIANVFGTPIEEIGNLGDAVNTLSNNMASTAPDIIDFMLRVGGSAKAMNISAEATAALGSSLVSLGLSQEVAGTAMAGMLTTLLDNESWSKSAAGAFSDLGLATEEFTTLVANDGVAALLQVREAIMALPKDEQIPYLSQMFGVAGVKAAGLFTSLELLDSALAMVGEGTEKTTEHLGSMEEEFTKMADTSANAMQLTKNMIDAATASIGEAFLPVLNELLMSLAPIIDKVTAWATANPELVRQIALVTASVLASIIGIKLFADGVTAAITTVQNLKTAFDLAKVGILALGSPIGLTIIAITALVLAGALIYQNWEQVKQIISDNRIAFGLLAVAVTGLGSVLLAAKLPMVVTAVQMGVMATASAAWSVAVGVATAATWTFNAALIVLTSPIFAIVAAIALITAGGYLVVKNWSAISAGLRAEFDRIKGAVMSAVNSMQAAWDRGVASTRTAFINIGNTISTTLKALPAKMMQVGREIVSGLINGIKSGASGVVTAIGSMASSAVAKAKSVLDIRSPSRVMKKVGEHTAEGMAEGIKKKAKVVKSEAQRMAEGAIKAVKDGIASLKKELALFGNDSKLASFNYDVSVGTFKGASSQDINQTRGLLSQIEAAKAEADAKTKLATANKSVQDSIDGLVKQQALFGNSSSLASLMYDIEHTDKYRDATKELTDNLIEQTRALEQLGMTAKATAAIQARFAQLGKDKEASQKAVDGVMGEIQQESPIGKIEADYKRRLDIVAENELLMTGIIGSSEAERLAIYQSYQNAKRDLMLTQGEALFGNLAGLSKAFLGEQSSLYKGLFAVQKAYTLASVLLKNKEAIAASWASAPFPYNIPAVAATVAGTAGLASAVSGIMPQGFKDGGYTGNMGASQVAGVVHGQEYVFDAQSTKRIGVDNLNAMRSGKAPTGGDVSINIINNSSAKVTASDDGQTITIEDVRNENKRSWSNLSNPNSFESKQVNRNVQAPRRR